MDRVLLVKTSSLGDVIHNLPVVSDIRRNFPKVKIDWLVEEAISFIPKMHPEVNDIFEIALRRWRKNPFSTTTWREIRIVRNKLKSVHYDAVIDTQGLLKSALLARWANGPSFGQDSKSAREPLAARLYTNVFPISRAKHAVERNRLLAALALGYEIPTSPADYGAVIQNSARPDFIPAGNYIFILHGTARPSKRWPEENWQQLSDNLASEGLHIVVGWGSDDEHKTSLALAAHNSMVVVPPYRLDIETSAQVIVNAKAVIGVDTGFSHLAAALGVPVIGIYCDTDPALSGVYGSGKAPGINVGTANQVPSVTDAMSALRQAEQPPGHVFFEEEK